MSSIRLLPIACAVLVLTGQACNSRARPRPKATETPTSQISTNGTTTKFSAENTMKLLAVTLSSTTLNAQLESTSGKSLTQFCDVKKLNCICNFRWQELVSSAALPDAGSKLRSSSSPLMTIQPAAAQCILPGTVAVEIPTDTPINISILNTDGKTFATTEVVLRKGQNQASSGGVPGSQFSDENGNSFTDILRYACTDSYTKSTITNAALKFEPRPQTGPSPAPNPSPTWVPAANRFCLNRINRTQFVSQMGLLAEADCAAPPTSIESSQGFGYSLYLNSSDTTASSEYKNYYCPKVSRPLTTSAYSSSYYPFDKNFALAMQRSADFSIGVEANVRLNSLRVESSGCSMTSNTGGGSSSGDNAPTILKGCLGFASRTRADGSCPVIKKNDGTTIQTQRLRRYIAIYPPVFDSDGAPLERGQPFDTIYVADRPVNAGAAAVSGTGGAAMLGPKPCPFAWVDRRGVALRGPNRVVATNSFELAGKNPDGISPPLQDRDSSTLLGIGMAAATTPSLDRSPGNWGKMHLVVPGAVGQSYQIRPVDSWAVHYEEDRSFEACAPPASNAIDPPIHTLVKAANDVRYCVEIYPTHAPGRGVALPAHTGITDASNSRPIEEPASGSRGVVLAPSAEIEAALAGDSSFACRLTNDGQGFTSGKVGKQTPSSCCGSTASHVETGSCQTPTL